MTNCLIKSTCHNIQLTEKYTWQYHYIIIMFFNLIRITQKWSWGPEHQPPSHNHNCFFFQTELGASLKKVSKAVLYFVGGILLAVTISLSLQWNTLSKFNLFFILSVRVVNLIAAGVEAFLNKYGCDSPLWQRRVTDSAPISYTMLHPGWTAASWPFHRALEPLCVLGTSLSPVPALPHHVYVLISIHMYSPIPFYCALVHR